MASEIEICNLALLRVGAPEIESLTDNNRQAGVVKKLYPLMRDAVLQGHDWGFARREESLAEIENVWQGYSYAYQYPADCLELRYLYNNIAPIGANISFDIRQSVDGNSRVVLCNITPAIAIFTAKSTNSGNYTPMFVDALAARLASELARVLIIDGRLATNWYQIYAEILKGAESSSANENVEVQSDTNSFINARN
jgi:hypothetical protein